MVTLDTTSTNSIAAVALTAALLGAVATAPPASSVTGTSFPTTARTSLAVVARPQSAFQFDDGIAVTGAYSEREIGSATAAAPPSAGLGTQTLLRLAEAIRSMADLPQDWDDAGATPLSPAVVDHALEWLNFFVRARAVPNRVYATSEGDVGFVWEADRGYADVVIGRTGVEYYARSSSGAQEIYVDQAVGFESLPHQIWSILATLSDAAV